MLAQKQTPPSACLSPGGTAQGSELWASHFCTGSAGLLLGARSWEQEGGNGTVCAPRLDEDPRQDLTLSHSPWEYVLGNYSSKPGVLEGAHRSELVRMQISPTTAEDSMEIPQKVTTKNSTGPRYSPPRQLYESGKDIILQ